MKKKIFVIIFILMVAAVGQSEAATLYTFEAVVDYTGISDPWLFVAGVDFNISGIEGLDWELVGFSAPYVGMWEYLPGGIFDDAFDGDDTATCDIGAYEAGEMQCFTVTGSHTFTTQSDVEIEVAMPHKPGKLVII